MLLKLLRSVKHVINDAEQIIVVLQDWPVYTGAVGRFSQSDRSGAAETPTTCRDPHQSRPTATYQRCSDGDLQPLQSRVDDYQSIFSAIGRIGFEPVRAAEFLANRYRLIRAITAKGIGLAIPTVLTTKVVNKLIRDGRVTHGYIGIGSREVALIHNGGGPRAFKASSSMK
ncbi:MAG: Serine endoprotease DegS [Sodalis sp.]|nr:MAG: Serine endoprotease DegS [Sodalis sp.]